MTRRPTFQPLARAVLRTQPDDRLVALSREGREAAFEEIVRRYRPGLVAFAAGYAPNDRAEDVVQESFIRSWDALRNSEGKIQLKPWLYTIVRNRALNARRDAKTHEPLPESLDGVRQPSEVALTNEELARVVAAVGALPDAQRKALVRSALDGRTHAQIATEMGATPGAVRQLIHRGRLAVREGAGLIIPLPIIRGLLELGSGAAAATGAAAGTTVAGTAGGGSMLAKATSVALVGVVAAGSGVAIKHAANSRHQDAKAEIAQAGSSAREIDGGPAAAMVTSGSGAEESVGAAPGHDSASGSGQASDDGGGSADDPLGSGGDQTPSAGSPGGSGSGDRSGDSGGSGAGSHGGGPEPGHDEAGFGEPDEGHSGPGGGGSGHEDADSDDPPEGDDPEGADSGSEDFGEQSSGESSEESEGPEPGSDEPAAEESGSGSGDGPPPAYGE